MMILALMFLLVFSSIAQATLVSFWGTVEIDGQPAPAGVVVSAYNDTSKLAQGVTQIIDNKAYYALNFNADGLVFFKVAGVNATQGLQDIGNGGSRKLNLSINRLENGEPCEYDIACLSGYCVNGACSSAPPVTTTTTIPPSGGGGGVVSRGGITVPGTGFFAPKCELDYSFFIPKSVEGIVNESVTIPVNVSMTKVECPPVDIVIELETPWGIRYATLRGLKEGDVNKTDFTITLLERGNFTLSVKSNNITKQMSLYVTEIIPTTTTTISPVTTTIAPKEAPTGLVASILKDPLAVFLIIVGLIIILFIIKFGRGYTKEHKGG
ncbi:MAG: hypothetical protein QXQ40_01715 [Candidatus Aenigmatarchaeota archaeon]